MSIEIFVFNVKHNQLKSEGLYKVAHEKCFGEQYKLPANYSSSVVRVCQNARATCEFCGERLDPAEAQREEDAIKKWISTGDRADYTKFLSERDAHLPRSSKIEVRGVGTIRLNTPSKIPNYTQLKTTSGNPEKPSVGNPRTLRRKGVKISGVESGGATIVTAEEKRLSEMSKLSEDELFGEE